MTPALHQYLETLNQPSSRISSRPQRTENTRRPAMVSGHCPVGALIEIAGLFQDSSVAGDYSDPPASELRFAEPEAPALTAFAAGRSLREDIHHLLVQNYKVYNF